MDEMLAVMLSAIGSEYGVEVTCTDSELFRTRFYAERNRQKKKGIEDYNCLQAKIVTDKKIFLIKKGTDNVTG